MSDEQLLTEITKLREAINRVEQMVSKMWTERRYMTIPQASKYYSISESRLRLLCKNDVIAGCYAAMNVNAKKIHYTIDTLKLDELIEQGGMIAFQLNKYMKR